MYSIKDITEVVHFDMNDGCTPYNDCGPFVGGTACGPDDCSSGNCGPDFGDCLPD